MRLQRLCLHKVGPFASLDLRFPESPAAEVAEIHLLVGPNGSGKSTILYALAQLFSFEVSLLAPRFWDADSYVVIVADDHVSAVVRQGATLPADMTALLGPHPRRRYSDGPLEYLDGSGASARVLAHHRDRASGPLPEPAHFARMAFVGRHHDPPPPSPIALAAFGYAGSRSVAPYVLQGIQEPTSDPLHDALSFTRTADSGALLQWIANTKAKHALALARGDTARAAERAAAIDRVARVIGDIIDTKVELTLEEEPLAVKLILNGRALAPDVLPEGLLSILSWIGDLLMRLDRLPWQDDTPALDRAFVLLLDEIEVHLHPAWQRRILPVVQRLFPNAQLIVSTHSPFVVGSVAHAWVHALTMKDESGLATARDPIPSSAGLSYPTILDEVFGIDDVFDTATESMLDRFYALRDQRLTGDVSADEALEEIADTLRRRSVETRDIVERELRQIERRLAAGT